MTESLLLAIALLAAGQPFTAAEILRQVDPGRLSPESFRARLLLRQRNDDSARAIEVWHSGRTRTLVRLLDRKERGKFFLRRDSDLWLLSPRTARPTRLPSSFRLYGGASLDETLGRFHLDDYAAVALTEEKDASGAVFVLSLQARDARHLLPRARVVASKDSLRLTRAEYFLRSGKLATTVTFQDWVDGRPRRFEVEDLIHKNASVRVEVLELEARQVPEGLFDLDDPTERSRLKD